MASAALIHSGRRSDPPWRVCSGAESLRHRPELKADMVSIEFKSKECLPSDSIHDLGPAESVLEHFRSHVEGEKMSWRWLVDAA